MLPLGLPKRDAYGDGLKRRDRQSSCFDRPPALALPLARSGSPPGLRRLRFPFFYALVKEQDLAVSDPRTIGSAFAAPIAKRERDLVPGYPDTLPRVKQEIAARCPRKRYSAARDA
jgi:hypothetical protein